MKTTRCVILTTAIALLLASGAKSQNAQPQQLEGKLVLRMPLRALQTKAPSAVRPNKLKDIGDFDTENSEGSGEIFDGKMLCTDAQSRLYFYDPINPKLALLRCVNRNGHEIEQWKLRTPNASYSASVTPDGYIWLSANDYEVKKNNFPIVVYKFGQSTPVLDWRLKPPFDTDQFVQQTLGKKYFAALGSREKESATIWKASLLGASKGKVQIELTNGGTGYSPDTRPDEKNYAITLRWTLTSDGKRSLQRDVYKSPVTRFVEQLGPDGTQWYVSDDLSYKTWKWNKAWLWKKGEKQGAPFLTYQALMDQSSIWREIYNFPTDQLSPSFLLDVSNHVYLLFNSKKLIIICDTKGEVIAYYQQTVPVLNPKQWIFSLPDGSGFYRQEKDDKELRIYFYALPKAK